MLKLSRTPERSSSSSRGETPGPSAGLPPRAVGEIQINKGKGRDVNNNLITFSPSLSDEFPFDDEEPSEDKEKGWKPINETLTDEDYLDEDPFDDEEEASGPLEDKGKGRNLIDDTLMEEESIPSFDENPFDDDEEVSGPQEDKGKGRSPVNEIQSDEEYALKIQAEDLQTAFQVMEDAQLARVLDEGAEAKLPSLREPSYTNQVAIALRQAALSVAAKQGLPGPSTLPQTREISPRFISSYVCSSSPLLHCANGPQSATTEKLQMVTTQKIFVSRFLYVSFNLDCLSLITQGIGRTPEHVSGLGSASHVLYPYTERPKSPAKFNSPVPKQDSQSLPPPRSPSPQSVKHIYQERH